MIMPPPNKARGGWLRPYCSMKTAAFSQFQLDGYDGAAIWDIGHLRWKIENNAFGELTQHWHLTHCSHHHPVAVVALLWIKIIAFTLFHAFAILHGKLFRLGKATFNEVRKQIYRSLLCGSPTQFFSG